MILKICVRLVLSLACMSSLVAASKPAPAGGPPTAETFARLPAIRHVNISRDGKVITYSIFADLQTMQITGIS